jgi:CRP/FNR family transcriptional regulator, cyclic AMP receptor protein
MSWLEVIGYIASVLVLTTFYMKTMIPLRYCAIASNIAFIAYGFLDRIYPVLVLHLLLLLLNIKRLVEIRYLIRDIKQAAAGEFSFDAMIPFLTKRTFRAGSTLFRKGDRAAHLYLLCQGSVRLPEIDVVVGEEGAIIGEIGLFAPDHQRTTSAICETEVIALILTRTRSCSSTTRIRSSALRWFSWSFAGCSRTGPARARVEDRRRPRLRRWPAPRRGDKVELGPSAPAPHGFPAPRHVRCAFPARNRHGSSAPGNAVSRRRRPARRAEPPRLVRSGECRQPEAPPSSASASAWRRPFEASAVPE